MTKNKFKFIIHKWIDIGYEDIPKTFINKIQGLETYKDQVINEHIYSTSIMDDLQELGIFLNEEETLCWSKILAYLEKADAGYFRIVYS